ncbi:oxidoreductase [Delitschia confertaspora ATCC 74209]|uniref:Oxidoreductase n=1 Tax=Delitschia confertaspora ATCC 74209 TaxID=1513339 RepID=A0A9P4MWG4_9PLEO|nr:oxidoreductase [Delitschia confertaspora ATCC 74209]
MVKFNPQTDIPELEGKVIFVTGGNTGLGKQTILYLAQHNPRKIYLAARTASKATSAIKDIKAAVPSVHITHIPLDLTSFSSIKQAASLFLSQETRLDILINNAGVMATPYSLTTDNYEIQFGTNHMGHALLTKYLLPTLEATAKLPGSDVRIINVSSLGHYAAPTAGIIFDQRTLEKKHTFTRYGQSKLANILFTRELARRYPSITSVSLHPGVIVTDLYASIAAYSVLGWLLAIYRFLAPILPGHYRDARGGALCQTWAAAGARKEELVNGGFYKPIGKLGGESRKAGGDGLAKKLFEWTESEFEKKGF